MRARKLKSGIVSKKHRLRRAAAELEFREQNRLVKRIDGGKK